jgi:hypothetical protein
LPSVNVDTTTSAGYVSGPLIKVAMDFLRVRNVNQLQISAGDPNYRYASSVHPLTQLGVDGTCRKLKGFLKGVKVIVRYKGSRQADRARPIRDLIEKAGFHPFECDGVETTVKVSLIDHIEYPVLTRPFAGILPEQAGSGTIAHKVHLGVPLTRAV